MQFIGTQNAKAQDSLFTFLSNSTVLLRDNNLQNPQSIESGASISIDPQFLLENLGTKTPTQEQILKLLLNPGEASQGKIVTQQFYNSNSRRPKNDYFFPVIINSKSGKPKTGKMAFHAYNRMGMLELKRTDGKDPAQYQSPEISEKLKTLIEQNRNSTEGQSCEACAVQQSSNEKKLAESIIEITQRPEIEGSMWSRYQEFAKDFLSTNGRATRARAGYYKRLYIKSLVDKFGAKDAGIILSAITGFAEAPHRNSNNTQIAEAAAVIKVIENRANNEFRMRSRTLRDIGIDESADSRLTNILADWQFSAWNDRDNNLVRILNFNPDTADSVTKRKMILAFDAQEKMATGQIEFIGSMNNSKMMHYHANYVNPNWDRAQNRIASPTIKVDGVSIDLSKQHGARHIFYTGLS